MTDAGGVWTHQLRLHYVEDIRFLQVQASLAVALAQLLNDSRVSFGDSHQVLFRSRNLEVDLRPSGVLLGSPDGPLADEGRRVLETLFERLEVEVWGLHVYVQHLLPLPMSTPAKAMATAARRLLGGIGSALNLKDCAVLADAVDDATGAEVQVEYGVLGAEEAPQRLARRVGRASGPTGNVDFSERSVPPVGLFVDSSWALWARSATAWPGTDNEIWTFSHECLQVSSTLAFQLAEKVSQGPAEEVVPQ